MKKILHMADLHFTGDKDKPKALSIAKDEIISYLRESAVNHEPVDLIVIAGDLFEERLFLDNPGVLEALAFVNALNEYAPILILRGTPTHDANSLYIFSKIRHQYEVRVVDTPTVFSNKKHPEMGFFCLPGMNKRMFQGLFDNNSKVDISKVTAGDLVKILLNDWKKKRKKYKEVVFIGHIQLDVIGLVKEETGYEPNIPLSLIEETIKPDIGLLGHIHQRGKYGNLFYSGCLIPLNDSNAEVVEFKELIGPTPLKTSQNGFYVHERSEKGWISEFHPIKGVNYIKILLEGNVDFSKVENYLKERLAKCKLLMVSCEVMLQNLSKETSEEKLKSIISQYEILKSSFQESPIVFKNFKVKVLALSSQQRVKEEEWRGMSISDKFFTWTEKMGIEIPEDTREEYVNKIQSLTLSSV